MDEIRRVALLMSTEIGYCRGLLRGVRTYANHTPNWVFHNATPHAQTLRPLREWQPHGIIAHLYDRSVARRVIAMRRPLVNTTNTLVKLKTPLVEVDNVRVGQLAAEHFLERGFTSFGYYGSQWTGFSRQRENGFRQALAEAGHALFSCHADYLPLPPPESSWKGGDRQARDWLLALAKPVAILASNDVPARQLAELCRQSGLRVPEDVALLGVDNDELECLLSTPPLSSVVNPAEQIGYEAAKLLDLLMSGRQPPQTRISVPPVHIICRQSTDIEAIADAEVTAGLAFIREHLADDLSVVGVAAHAGTSRRGLERHFRRHLGRSILQEIHRARIERAKCLLAETDLPVLTVARRSGFATRQRLGVVFRQAIGLSPVAYRRAARDRP